MRALLFPHLSLYLYLVSKYRHFIFDIDGTLVDTERTCVLSLQNTIRELMDQERSYDELYPYFGIPSAKVAGMLSYPDEEGFLHRWEANFMDLMYLMTTFPGVPEMLAALKESGMHIGVVTSRSKEEYAHDRNMHAMEQYLDISICAEDSVRHKPDPDPVLSYMRKASEAFGEEVRPEECIYIGDTLHDCMCAHGAGCDFALADWRRRGAGSIEAEHIVHDCAEMLALMEII